MLGCEFGVRREAQEWLVFFPSLCYMQEQTLPGQILFFVPSRCHRVAVWAHVVRIPLHKVRRGASVERF